MKRQILYLGIVALILFSPLCFAEAPPWANSDDKSVEKLEFVHYVKPKSQESSARDKDCYKLMGIKWGVLPVNYVINPANPQGLDESFIANAIFSSAEAWDSATSKELSGSYSIDYSAQYGVRDDKNSLVFGSLSQGNVIAMTAVWYAPKTKRILEFDIVFNTNYQWGDATLDSSRMDLQNIATHELGHAFGLGDLYLSSCSAVTMFGYSAAGETSKRSLEQPDIAGLQRIYGA
ncbi:MAG: matrixin family metalloprotease [Candidatus Micrarchaeota archaeon]|nr:matrixin family metalloprotease [Candidatus Micrarchaeota archaeon]